MARVSKDKLRSIGNSIMSEAKRIRKANPRKKWQTCVKEAGTAYRRKHR